MSTSGRKNSLLIGAFLALSLVIGLAFAPTAFADERTEDSNIAASDTISSSDSSVFSDTNYQYQGKGNLKEYWDTVQSYRSEISDMSEVFESLELSEERQAQIEALMEEAQEETNLEQLELIQTELTSLLDEWTIEALEAAYASSAKSYSVQNTSYYNYAIQSGILTRSGGVNSFGGRTETWYSQKVLPGGGLNIPGRHVAEDGTIRDADGYIVVAASDLPYGSTIETSLGAGKVYDTGCAAGITDIYTDW